MKHDIVLTIDGRETKVAPGTTVAAAIWNTSSLELRTSVSGEMRGPACGMGICHECRVTIDGISNQRSCLIQCDAGMKVETDAG